METPDWTPPATKLRFYEALHYLNRSFEATLLSLDRLRGLQIFRAEFLTAWSTKVEYIRAAANEELLERLQEYEQEDSARFDALDLAFEKQRGDPNDVLLAAETRKREIRDEIRGLQRALKKRSQRKGD